MLYVLQKNAHYIIPQYPFPFHIYQKTHQLRLLMKRRICFVFFRALLESLVQFDMIPG